ncbi:MAG: hypothetical protein ACJAXS_001975, partial [Colwellia sp.]
AVCFAVGLISAENTGKVIKVNNAREAILLNTDFPFVLIEIINIFIVAIK